PKALPLETTSFLKKAGQKFLFSLLYLLITFFLMARPQNKHNTEKMAAATCRKKNARKNSDV
ncbi:MAG: hypothetical protein ACI4JM_12460, partial [Oscillospiraceae bacterium]